MRKKLTLTRAFGQILSSKRMELKIALREVCRRVNFDHAYWKKIETGQTHPPTDIKTLSSWAEVLGIKEDTWEYSDFIDAAYIAGGKIPPDILKGQTMQNLLHILKHIRYQQRQILKFNKSMRTGIWE